MWAAASKQETEVRLKQLPMNRNIMKIGILGLLLLVPVFFILFLNQGENHFEVKNFTDAEGNKTKYLLGYDEVTPHTVPSFSFVDQNGKQITEKDIAGKIAIVDYVFTRCATICPKMSRQMERVQDAFKNEKDVIILSHTVDPEFDKGEVLKTYAKLHGAIDGKWHFLTGDKATLYKQAADGYRIVAKEEASGPDAFVHSDKMVLVDRQGHIRGYYSGVDSAKVDTLILETKVLLTEKSE